MPFLFSRSTERIYELTNFAAKRVMTIGLQVLSEDSAGLKIVPHRAIVFAIGPVENPEEIKFAISSPLMARAVGKSILDMCDDLEGKW
jgi:hypothetical protein